MLVLLGEWLMRVVQQRRVWRRVDERGRKMRGRRRWGSEMVVRRSVGRVVVERRRKWVQLTVARRRWREVAARPHGWKIQAGTVEGGERATEEGDAHRRRSARVEAVLPVRLDVRRARPGSEPIRLVLPSSAHITVSCCHRVGPRMWRASRRRRQAELLAPRSLLPPKLGGALWQLDDAATVALDGEVSTEGVLACEVFAAVRTAERADGEVDFLVALQIVVSTLQVAKLSSKNSQ